MGEIVNLRQARKAKARVVAAETAAVRRAQFGRSKAGVAGEKAERARAARVLDGALLEVDVKSGPADETVPGEPSPPTQPFP
nr:DUF4169 family protein [Sphingomonas montana]